MSEHIHARWEDSRKESSVLAQTCLGHTKGKPSPYPGKESGADEGRTDRERGGNKVAMIQLGEGSRGREAVKIRSG